MAGFRHSAMVNEGDEIKSLYDYNYSPTQLLKDLVKSAIELNNVFSEDICYEPLKIQELELINGLRNEPYTKGLFSQSFRSNDSRIKLLYDKTRTQSYSVSIAYHGESLKKTVNKYKNDPSFLKNNRYLFAN